MRSQRKNVFFKPFHFLGDGAKDKKNVKSGHLGVKMTCACSLAGDQHHVDVTPIELKTPRSQSISEFKPVQPHMSLPRVMTHLFSVDDSLVTKYESGTDAVNAFEIYYILFKTHNLQRGKT